MERGALAARRFRLFIAALGGFLAAPRAMAQSGPDSASLRWAVPTTMPAGALVAVVSGDPYAAGETTFLIAMPGGYRIPPHFHPSEVRIGVREGSLLVGMGDRVDRNRARLLGSGDSAAIPAGKHHFWLAGDRAVVTMTFTGPFTITYIRAVDAPRTKAFPVGY